MNIRLQGYRRVPGEETIYRFKLVSEKSLLRTIKSIAMSATIYFLSICEGNTELLACMLYKITD